MDTRQIALVQETFKQVLPIKETAADLFYTRLFEVAPSVRGLFPDELTDQGAKLMATLGVAVAGLTSLDSIIPTVQKLGARHVEYGAEDAHYAGVGEVLLWTLEQGLGDAFTPDVKDAWASAYTILADVMIEAANAQRDGAAKTG